MIPQSQDAEKGFLSSAIHNISIFDVHADTLKEGLFHTRNHKAIFKALLALWKEGASVDIITLGDYLEKHGLMDEAGGHSYIAELFTYLPTGHNHEEYITILRQKHTSRLAIAAAEKIITSANNPALGGDLSEVVQKALVSVAAEAESASRIESIGEAALKRIDEYEAIFRNQGKLMGLTTGLKSLDSLSGGMKAGQLIVLGAPTKGGKSAFALNVALRTAQEGNAVGYISLEMSSGELVDRLVASFTGVDISVLSNAPTKDQVNKIGFGAKQIRSLPIWIRDESQVNPLQLRAATRRMVATHGVKLVVVDYIQLCDPTDRKESRERQVAEISRTLKQVAKELGITILALTQLNAEGNSRESQAVMHDCDSFWVIRNETEERKNGKETYQVPTDRYWLDIRLARAHARGSIPMKFHSAYLRFDEVENNPNT